MFKNSSIGGHHGLRAGSVGTVESGGLCDGGVTDAMVGRPLYDVGVTDTMMVRQIKPMVATSAFFKRIQINMATGRLKIKFKHWLLFTKQLGSKAHSMLYQLSIWLLPIPTVPAFGQSYILSSGGRIQGLWWKRPNRSLNSLFTSATRSCK